ncbi:MAG: S-layer homology domain-containing protein [Clostridiales bacterium]|jgi:hypothetical protein|nr:S-layer homology domain-containing protein [Clostridiales bacterium]
MRRKIFTWMLTVALLLNVSAANINASEGGFTDIGNHWAKEIIEKFTEQDILSGYPDGTFKPDGYLHRSEAVILLNEFFNITESGYPNYSDVKPDDWFYFQIGAAQERSYATGYPDGTFRPGNNITRLEAFIMIYNLLGAPDYYNVAVLDRFTDTDLIPKDKPLYRQVVAYMADHGILNAYPDGSLRVNDFITRVEMLPLLNKISDMITNTNTETEPSEATPSPTITPEATLTETPTPTPAVQQNNWPAPLPPGNNWHTTGSGLNPSSITRSGSDFSRGSDSVSRSARTYERDTDDGYDRSDSDQSSGEIIPKDLFSLNNGSIDIQENAIVITDADKVYLNKEYTLPKGTKLELRNSTLILKADLNITDENDLVGDRSSAIIEEGGVLNIGSGVIIARGLRSFVTPDTYYYDTKSGKWRPLK